MRSIISSQAESENRKSIAREYGRRGKHDLNPLLLQPPHTSLTQRNPTLLSAFVYPLRKKQVALSAAVSNAPPRNTLKNAVLAAFDDIINNIGANITSSDTNTDPDNIPASKPANNIIASDSTPSTPTTATTPTTPAPHAPPATVATTPATTAEFYYAVSYANAFNDNEGAYP